MTPDIVRGPLRGGEPGTAALHVRPAASRQSIPPAAPRT